MFNPGRLDKLLDTDFQLLGKIGSSLNLVAQAADGLVGLVESGLPISRISRMARPEPSCSGTKRKLRGKRCLNRPPVIRGSEKNEFCPTALPREGPIGAEIRGWDLRDQAVIERCSRVAGVES